MKSKKFVRDLHTNDSVYTWYKLSEWMQVEIMDLMVKSLDHAAWFRFPFMEILQLYFKVLYRESRVVREFATFSDTYLSVAFATDVVPGIVMMFIFAQLRGLVINYHLIQK